ncbi:hypothetical protein FQN60_007285 [Etheostoma spectabile]|uniref:Uncharacterized protein n=1 Tax=Etheostoma spectabile TaxID=54343 RepID=A0A5J5C7V7_9PERO|nr:hypothetical protein FQN60_007285 [Etheostoma spectabile]
MPLKNLDPEAAELKRRISSRLVSKVQDRKEDESSLIQLFDDRDKSPFSQEKLTKWLDQKEREINVISSCADTMEGTKIVPNQTELDRVVLAPGVDNVLCFVFTSVERGDTDLDVMADYLHFSKLGIPMKIHGTTQLKLSPK